MKEQKHKMISRTLPCILQCITPLCWFQACWFVSCRWISLGAGHCSRTRATGRCRKTLTSPRSQSLSCTTRPTWRPPSAKTSSILQSLRVTGKVAIWKKLPLAINMGVCEVLNLALNILPGAEPGSKHFLTGAAHGLPPGAVPFCQLFKPS